MDLEIRELISELGGKIENSVDGYIDVLTNMLESGEELDIEVENLIDELISKIDNACSNYIEVLSEMNGDIKASDNVNDSSVTSVEVVDFTTKNSKTIKRIHIVFNEKPNEDIRNKMKAQKFKYDSQLKLWQKKYSEDDYNFALSL